MNDPEDDVEALAARECAAWGRKLAALRDFYAGGSCSLFSPEFRRSLSNKLGGKDAAGMVEAECVLGAFGDPAQLVESRRRVHAFAAQRGHSIKRRKPESASVAAFVKCLSPLLLQLGVSGGIGENSPHVAILRDIAAQLGLRGDPRDELRFQARKRKRGDAEAYRAVFGAVERAWTLPE